MPIWSEKEDDKLRELFDHGLSASQIAGWFADGRTRNAVIGRLHRLGAVGDRKKARQALPRAQRPSVIMKPTRVQGRSPKCKINLASPPLAELKSLADEMRSCLSPSRKPMPALIIEDLKTAQGGIDLMDLQPHHCRFPLTNESPHKFCGQQKADGVSYCAHHAERCYAGSPSRRMPDRRAA